MKKFLIVFLAILSVSVIAVLAIVFVPKAVNESQINKLSSGGVIESETIISSNINSNSKGTVKLEEGKMEYCLTLVNGQTDFVKVKEHIFLIGKYSLDSDKNIIIDVEERYAVLELDGDEQSKEDYIKIHTQKSQSWVDYGQQTLEEHNKYVARLNGEKYEPIEDYAIDSVKLRMDTENNTFYLISFETKDVTVEYSYDENGLLKSEKVKKMGITLSSTEYDKKGNLIRDDAEIEFHDNGVIKNETYMNGQSTFISTYDNNGRLEKLVRSYSNGNTDVEEYIYNDDGICVLIKRDNDGYYSEKEIIGYGRIIETHYTQAGKTSKVIEYYGEETVKEETFVFDDRNTSSVNIGNTTELITNIDDNGTVIMGMNPVE